ncbi:glycosyl hydrolase family 18 protein [Streptomyces flavidovirens]|uniref:glycosyl hydrolase family 18 protein n=1 Tax=Streptomyces flavidovirens TaxID=67298 RepID=UPI00343FBAB5
MATRILSVLAAAGLMSTAALFPAPAGPDSEPLRTATPRTVSAWLPYWDQDGAYRDALSHADQLHTVSPFWYHAVSAGRVDGHPGAGERRVIDGLHAAGIKVVPTVNETMKPGALGSILTSPTRRATHIRTLLKIAESRDYDGLDLDYETIAATGDATYKQVRAGYAKLVEGVCEGLRAVDKQCVVTVSPKTATTGRIWDYTAIGRAADRMRVMAYDYHWKGGKPGPLCTPQWYDEILRVATAEVPADKIEVGLPAYGWDWPADGRSWAKHVTWKEAEALRLAKGVPYTLDPVSRTPHFSYLDDQQRREVWYQDARGVAEHLPVLRKYGVANTALWALNFEDPELWPVLARG